MKSHIYEGLKTLAIESIENGICIEDVKFTRVPNVMKFSTSVSTDRGTYPVHAQSSNDLDVFYYNGYIKMNIPKLMPFYNVRRPYESTIKVDKRIIINSKDTLPNIFGTVTICNYIKVRAPRVLMTTPGVKYGDNITCVFPNKNIKNPSFLPI